MSDILELAVKCIDASLSTSAFDHLDNSDIADDVDALIMGFRAKFEIPNDTEIGNADAVEDNYDAYRAAKDQMEQDIFQLCWDHIKELMLDCGLGDVTREVLDSELTGIQPSWERKK